MFGSTFWKNAIMIICSILLKNILVQIKSKITFEIINAENRPVSATAGQVEVRNVKKVEVSYNLKKTLRLLFDKDHNLEQKILDEQFIL